ncbi:MAG: hypothetical protein ACRD19_01330, partial [Terriglobia bacterium]
MAIAIATGIAGLFAAVAAGAAVWQGRASWKQVKLLRPRPVVVIEGSWTLENAGMSAGFTVRNLGSSPAFDIKISKIEGPRLPSVGYPEALATERIHALAEKSEVRAVHYRCVPGTTFPNQVLPFLQEAARAFPLKDQHDNFIQYHDLTFWVSYLALDGRLYK